MCGGGSERVSSTQIGKWSSGSVGNRRSKRRRRRHGGSRGSGRCPGSVDLATWRQLHLEKGELARECVMALQPAGGTAAPKAWRWPQRWDEQPREPDGTHCVMGSSEQRGHVKPGNRWVALHHPGRSTDCGQSARRAALQPQGATAAAVVAVATLGTFPQGGGVQFRNRGSGFEPRQRRRRRGARLCRLKYRWEY